MDDDRVVSLLEEIRDLQRQQVEAYQQAIRNQQDAVQMQRVAVGRARRLQAFLGVVIFAVLATVLVLLRYVLRRYA